MLHKKLEHKIAIITGAASGIGKASAIAMAQEGATVIIADVDKKKGQQVAEIIGQAGSFYQLDVADEKNWQDLTDHVMKEHGRLDVIVNNAGIVGVGNNFGLQDPESASLADWHKVFAVNMDGVFLGCKYAIQMMKEKGGSIVNMSSRSGIVGVPNMAAYAASKAGIRNHTKSVALYCASQGYDIRCNSIHPATIMTPMWEQMLGQGAELEKKLAAMKKTIPMQRFGTPEEVANLVVFLASNESSYMTGSELVMDGGILAGSAAAPTR